MTKTEEQKRVKVNLLFIGKRKTAKGDLAFLWQEIEVSMNNGSALESSSHKECIYGGKPLLKSLYPGMIIEIDRTEDGKSVFPSTAKIVGTWECEDDVEQWSIYSRAIEREFDQAKESIKKMKAGLPLEALEPFRKAYQNAYNSTIRSQILAMVIQEVTAR